MLLQPLGGVRGLGLIDAITREVTLFAAVGLLIGGVDDLIVDAIFLIRRAWRGGPPRLRLATLPRAAHPGRIAVFVPAWDEAAVIGRMVAAALDRYDHADYRLYVGLYPNDLATIRAVEAVAKRDSRVRLVVGSRPGPTSKADCLNTLWRALVQADAAEGMVTKAVVLHDAEDLVHPAELIVFDALIERHAVVQLPVQPLTRRGARFVASHYADEFAESHMRTLVVRTALGAGMPLAGTGCAIRPAMLTRMAEERGGDPFDPSCLVEDYELGLGIARSGGSGIFARVGDGAGGVVAVRAYFPSTMRAAVRQKARWMYGIALAGWDRTGWGGTLVENWMRLHDRRALLAVIVLATAYLALILWPLVVGRHWFAGTAPTPPDPLLAWLLVVNAGLLTWRCFLRVVFTARVYGWREGLWSLPRLVVGNVIALLAARRALTMYLRSLRGTAPGWDKTGHDFPDLTEPAQR